jgi:hypothetical protein
VAMQLRERLSLVRLHAVIFRVRERSGEAREPGWDWRVVTFGDQREKIQETPILERDYRPLHFYGNTVRRMHYRGTPLPLPKSVVPTRPRHNR